MKWEDVPIGARLLDIDGDPNIFLGIDDNGNILVASDVYDYEKSFFKMVIIEEKLEN